MKCRRCGREYRGFKITCECGGLLSLEVDIKGSFSDFIRSEYQDARRYLDVLPLDKKHVPSLIYPVTPVVKKSIGGVDLVFKAEYLMPSGSFKDRGTFLSVAILKKVGIKDISLDSSGNAGISFSMYGVSEGIRVHVFIPKNTPKGKKDFLRVLGAIVHVVDGDREVTHSVAINNPHGLYVGHWYNPFFVEGIKTMAFEAYEQIGTPDYVIVPVGSGTIFLGLYYGFKTLFDLGEVDEVPRMVAVQASGYESLCEKKSEERSILADGIAIRNPPRIDEMREALKETRGTCVVVSDGEIKEALRELYGMGFIVEPTSAVSYAAFKILLREGIIEKGRKVLLPLTGSGLKVLESILKILK